MGGEDTVSLEEFLGRFKMRPRVCGEKPPRKRGLRFERGELNEWGRRVDVVRFRAEAGTSAADVTRRFLIAFAAEV